MAPEDKRRRSVMLDSEHAELLRMLAGRYGVSMASYLRSLVRAAWEAEEKGLNAASLLRRSMAYEMLTRLGAMPVPLNVLSHVPLNVIRSAGRELGESLAGLLGYEGLSDLLAGLVERLGLGVAEYQRILMLPQNSADKKAAAELLTSIARGAGMKVVVEDGMAVIIPSDTG
ncbi:MAG: hypothetical protein DSY37_00470 [Hyperthermus sp.]|nr:MAG: hypothetical protein DSY37_00470 [Hyperthermus sp.]